MTGSRAAAITPAHLLPEFPASSAFLKRENKEALFYNKSVRGLRVQAGPRCVWM